MTDAEYEALPPLVPKGEDREAVIERVVEGWCTSLGETDPEAHARAGGFVLRKVALVDGNTNEPIDLGELTRRVAERLAENADAPASGKTRHILLFGCLIPKCDLSEQTIPCTLIIRRGLFRNNADISQVVFKGISEFAGTRFGVEAHFGGATFGDWARFGGATFGDEADFGGVRFGKGLLMASTGFEPPGGIDGAVVPVRPDDEPKTRKERVLQRFGRILRWCDWNRVRAVGELHVLTKATYTALLVVPLVAGGWQTMRVVLNGVHHSVREARQEFDASAIQLRELVERLPQKTDMVDELAQVTAKIDQLQKSLEGLEQWVPNAEIRQKIHEITRSLEQAKASLSKTEQAIPDPKAVITVIDQVQGRIDRLYREHGPETWTRPVLPVSWVLGYLAALCVALGHFLYQVKAPEEVRKLSRDAFRERRNREFREAPEHEERDLIERAFPFLVEMADRLPHDRHPNLVKRNGRAMWIPGGLSQKRPPRGVVGGQFPSQRVQSWVTSADSPRRSQFPCPRSRNASPVPSCLRRFLRSIR
ncbi:hypothetical protein BH23PLA1_BH23PLA1_38260 [soil metagenome]